MAFDEPARPIDVLLVEDNPGDARLTQEALKEAKGVTSLHIVNDGAKALAYLRKGGAYQAAPTPDIVLLDLNLPGRHGTEVLSEIKGDPQLRHIVVVVMTTSRAEEDILRAYNLHANAFITKPVDLNQFFNVVKSIEGFWLTFVRFAPKPSESS